MHVCVCVCVCVFMCIMCLYTEIAFENGKVFGIWYVGNTVYTVS